MNKTYYARISETGAVEFLNDIPNVSNPTDAQLASYAMEHGYKVAVSSTSPGIYYTPTWEDTGDTVTERWVPWDLDVAKKAALGTVQGKRNAAMNNVVIPCENIPNGILYTTEAMTMAQGLVILQSRGALPEDITWTDAGDETHKVTPALLDSIVKSMFTHVSATQARFATVRDDIHNAEDVDEVEQALSALTWEPMRLIDIP